MRYKQCKQCKLKIGLTSYTLQYRQCLHCKHQRNVGNVDYVNSVLFKQHRRRNVDGVYVQKISARSTMKTRYRFNIVDTLDDVEPISS